MTSEEKTALARFFDLAEDYLKEGHQRTRNAYTFKDDPSEEPQLPEESFSSLPLAYQVNEEETGYTSIEEISDAIGGCKACALGTSRLKAVPGEGVSSPLVMVIGEGPGADEDKAGRPFVGRAGQLLDKMLESIGLSREKNCYIANIVKCRPPENRDPEPEEITACFPYLEGQIQILRPDLILCAGRVAAQKLLKTSKGINSLRGVFSEFYTVGRVVPVLCTFHPSAILRDETLKRPAWEDLKLLRSKLNSLNEE